MERLNKLNIYLFGKCLNKYHKRVFEKDRIFAVSHFGPLVKYYKGWVSEVEQEPLINGIYEATKKTRKCKICGEEIITYDLVSKQ